MGSNFEQKRNVMPEDIVQEEHSKPPEQGQQRAYALILLSFTIYQSFLTTGIIYGWPAMLLMLRHEGVYKNRCHSNLADVDCHDRTVALNFVFTIGVAIAVAGGLVLGRIVDLIGPKYSIVVGLFTTIIGSCIIALSPVEGDAAWPIAYVAYGIGGTLVHLPSFSLGNSFGPA